MTLMIQWYITNRYSDYVVTVINTYVTNWFGKIYVTLFTLVLFAVKLAGIKMKICNFCKFVLFFIE